MNNQLIGRYLAVIAIALVVGCAARAKSLAPEVVNFASSGAFPSPRPNIDFTETTGAFGEVDAKIHTTIEPRSVAAGTTVMAALLGGSIDYAVTSGNAFGRAAMLGQPIVALMEVSHAPGGVLAAPIKFEKRGTGLAALKTWSGAAWGITSVGGAGEFDAQRAAENAGLNWSAQNLVFTGSVAATVAGMLTGRIDIGAMDILPAAQIVAKTEGFVVVNFVKFEGDYAWNHQLDWVLVARKKFVAKYPALTGAIVRAEVKGLLKAKELKDDPAGALALYQPKVRSAVSLQAFAIYWAACIPSFEGLTGLITPDAMHATKDILKAMGAVTSDHAFPAGSYDNSFLRAAYKDLNLPLPR